MGRERGPERQRKPILMFYIYLSPNSSCVSAAACQLEHKPSSQACKGAPLSGSQPGHSQCCLTKMKVGGGRLTVKLQARGCNMFILVPHMTKQR